MVQVSLDTLMPIFDNAPAAIGDEGVHVMSRRLMNFLVAVKDIPKGIETYTKLFGLKPTEPIGQRRWGFLGCGLGVTEDSEPLVIVIQPNDPNSAVARFMQERANPRNPDGEGIYLVAMEVDDVAEVVQQVQDQGGRVIQDEQSPGAAWVHPVDTHYAFIELQQAGGG